MGQRLRVGLLLFTLSAAPSQWSLQGADATDAPSPELQAPQAEAQNATQTLAGLILLNSQDAVLKEGDPGLTTAGVKIVDVPTLDTEDFRKRIGLLIGKPIDSDLLLLKEVQKVILAYYRKQGYPLVDVVFPPQTVSGGIVQAVVVESKLGQVVFEGTNKWTSVEYIRKNLGVHEGESISEQQLTSDLKWLNGNRFRSIDMFFKPGEEALRSDLVVRTSDRFPLGGSVGIDNYGNRFTGQERISAGFEWGKAFGLNENSLSYRYLTDVDLEFLRAHIASYEIRFPWRHKLSLSGSYSEIKGDLPSPFTQDGTSIQGNLRYEIELPRWGAYRHSFAFGGDFRRLDNTLEFNAFNVSADTTEIVQGVLTYSGLFPDKWGSTFWGGEYFYSPGGITDLNSDTRFVGSYPFTDSSYMYAKLNLERVTRLPMEFSWRVSGAYQLADGNLLPSEQLGLGGSATIRGYEERLVNGTEGYVISNELRAPSFSPGRWMDKTAKDEMQILGFFDYGETSNRTLQLGEDPHIILSSVGVGMRYQVSRFFTVRFDYGWRLTDPFEGVPGARNLDKSRGHISAMLNF